MARIPASAVALAERMLPAAVVRRMRVAVYRRRRRRYPRRIVEHAYAGVRHKVLIASAYGEAYDRDWPKPEEIRWLEERRLQPGARVFNLGASYGVIAMMLADSVGATGQVIALEAHPADADILQRNRDMNAIRHLTCLHAAVAHESGTVTFGIHGSVDDGSRRWGDMRIDAHSIDDLATRFGDPDVVFIDVEGYESEALKGATQTLAAGPDWFVEVHFPHQLGDYGADATEVLGYFEQAGYSVSILFDQPYVRLEDGSIRALAPPRPLGEIPPELLAQRFYLLAHRHADDD